MVLVFFEIGSIYDRFRNGIFVGILVHLKQIRILLKTIEKY